VRYRGDWDGRRAAGGRPGPLHADPRRGGDNDGWRPPSRPRPPLGAPPRLTRGPPFFLNHFGGGARLLAVDLVARAVAAVAAADVSRAPEPSGVRLAGEPPLCRPELPARSWLSAVKTMRR